ncbi:sodium/potassium-transporting ATPase subunit alpha-B-like [Harmonia axyridis]|uniref:sodium/potassium-transporting ATPase subunit alpha-B-like n=1 Tax=Harmonia axyridis TaxID=115357 RepID=UPI001E27840B|nr:sodium/potassium-transporting ATPase subunit alpha-B-like [Harmonia axyridis]
MSRMSVSRMRGMSMMSATSISSSGVSYKKPLVVQRTDQEMENFRKEISTDAHEIPLQELLHRLGTNAELGLTRAKADTLLKINGPNCLVASQTKSRYWIFLGFMFGGFAALLWIGALLSLLGFTLSYINDPDSHEGYDHLYLGCVLLVVVIFSGFFGFYQESSSEKIMDSFKRMIPSYAMVIRDGIEYTLPSEELVVGDLVELFAGSTIPADIRVIDSASLKVDNSSITGESDPQSKYPKCTSENPLETANLAFYSTNIVEGRGRGIVISCGDDTLIGHIAGLTTALKKEETPIHKEIRRFIKIITVLAIAIGLTFFILCLNFGYNFFVSFSFFIALIIANVPEGLPVTLTACMTLTAKRMASKNCLVKKLEAIETLGACNVICSDKTGTLTQNRMTVSHMFFDGQEWDVLKTLNEVPRDSEAFEALVEIAMLCSRATFIDKDKNIPIEERTVAGDASESAILKFLEALIGNVAQKRELKPKICEIPFNSNNKFQLSIHKLVGGRNLLVIKGAPERIIMRCKKYLSNDRTVELDDDLADELLEAILNLGRKGERVLAFADYYLPETYGADYVFNAEKQNFPVEGYRFVGFLSMMDPPRFTVPEAVRMCKEAGIRVIMVTGDHPVTAEAIAKKVGIISEDSIVHTDILKGDNDSMTRVKHHIIAGVVTGNDLREMTDHELEMALVKYRELIFARTSPQQKLKIVEALQKQKLIVAVTGDGVNDSPALKKADIGIAMGIAGSDVAKNAADMILLDDNFSSIVTGIEEGRLIFDNLKKSIAYVLTSNVPEIVPFIVLVGFNLPQSLTVMAIVLIDIGTDLWPAISLAYEKPEADIMKRCPRNPVEDRLINTRLIYLAYGQIGFIQSVGAFIVYFFIMAQHGFFYDRLIGIRVLWDSETINDLQDSYGEEWTYPERMYLQRKCVAGFFVSIVMTQTTDLLICKTRKLSLFQQGMSNRPLNYSICFAMAVMLVSVYCPGVRDFFQFEPVDYWPYVLTLPFVLIIFCYDEGRKWLIRRNPYGFAARETYY